MKRIVIACCLVSGCLDGEAELGPTDVGPTDVIEQDVGTGSCGLDLAHGDPNHYRCSVQGHDVYVYLPVGYSTAQKYPVIVNLHGGSGNAANAEEQARLHTPYTAGRATNFADTHGIIVVEPEGTSLSAVFPGKRTWNAGNCCGPGAGSAANVDDVGFLKTVVSQLSTSFAVDRKRVFVAGLSNGGMMAHRLACQAGDVFAAAVSLSGGRSNLDPVTGRVFYTCSAGRKAAILEIHGDTDGCYDWNGGPGALARDTTFRSVPDSMDFGGDWGTLHSCGPLLQQTYAMSDGATATTCWQYRNCDMPGAVTLCKVTGGGHMWPGGPAPYGASSKALCGGVKPQTIGNDYIWSFMSAHPM